MRVALLIGVVCFTSVAGILAESIMIQEENNVLPVWESLLDAANAFGYDTTELASRDRTSPWQATDQDLLNIVVMTTDVPLSTLGPECMDFRPGGYVMSHAVNSPKPWARDYMEFALDAAPGLHERC